MAERENEILYPFPFSDLLEPEVKSATLIAALLNELDIASQKPINLADILALIELLNNKPDSWVHPYADQQSMTAVELKLNAVNVLSVFSHSGEIVASELA
jgi:hypothetical protein